MDVVWMIECKEVFDFIKSVFSYIFIFFYNKGVVELIRLNLEIEYIL